MGLGNIATIGRIIGWLYGAMNNAWNL